MVRSVLCCWAGWVLLALCLGASPAHADVAWLCAPGVAENPCVGDQTTTHVTSDGAMSVEAVTAPATPPIDCFYVYPTVSNQATTNATATADPEVRSVAIQQAQRFSTRCRVFAPLYRQVTAAGVTAASDTHDTAPYAIAYGDVEAAWRAYLADDNDGRGVVLIGHSQGSRMLRALIKRQIDPDASARRRLIAAIIPGANLTEGEDPNVPACARRGQDGCIVAYSTYDEVPPANSRFGRTDTDPVGTALDLPGGPVVCTDPTMLSGDAPNLHSLLSTAPFAPGVIAALELRLYGGAAPTASTPWLEPQDHYTARCEQDAGSHVLMISPIGAARHLTPSPDSTWGTHLADINLPLGNLLSIVDNATATWTADHRPLAATLKRRSRRRVDAAVTGPPGASVRVVLRQRGKSVAKRTAVLSAGGRRTVRFTRFPRGGALSVRVAPAS